MTVKELILRLLEHPLDCEVCSTTKDDVTFGVLEPAGWAIYCITLKGKSRFAGKVISET